jgi:hypothetical protein
MGKQLLIFFNLIWLDINLSSLDGVDRSCCGRRFKADEPPSNGKVAGAVQGGVLSQGSGAGQRLLGNNALYLHGVGGLRDAACARRLSGWVAPAVVLDIFGALSLAWRDLVVLDDPPS